MPIKRVKGHTEKEKLMGLAASQARLLMLTARIHDVEYQAQMIQSAKLELALQEDEVYRKYTEALDATTLTFTNDQGALIPASFNNLCGEASINNGLNKKYVFRTADDDRLIVPSDIFDAYKNYGGGDPYAFAMEMMGIDPETLAEAEEKYAASQSTTDLQSLRDTMDEKLEAIANARGIQDVEGLKNDIKGNESIEGILPDETDSNYDTVKKLIEEYKNTEEEYRYKLYQRGGAENIYGIATGQKEPEDFDQARFNYYMRWGKLIEEEVGIEHCISEKFYSEEFGNDSEALNQMLQSGRITVDVVNIDKKGSLSSDTTSVAADSSLAYTNTSTIDKKALAVAEAEYEHAMKKIDKKDKQYDMELNKLETERSALTTEYDSVKKVIDDNIKRTFGIFS